jgi:thiamine-monophosphate kinase
MPPTVRSLGEFGLIDSIRKFQAPHARVIQGIGDDAAVLALDRRRYQLFTTDMLVEGVHFTRGTPAALIGRKSVACSISDIAAMGGIPTAAVVSIGLPAGVSAGDVQAMYAGMSKVARQFGVSIVGGDTVKASRLVINVALLGEVDKKDLVLRSGARPGDMIMVSGPLGNTLGSGRHLTFTPRVKEARFLVKGFRPSAMMDVSDGLAGDLGHILKAAGAGAILDTPDIPRNPGATLGSALTGGEDFELLFTIPPARGRRLLAAKSEFRFFPVGFITAGKCQLYLRDAGGQCRPCMAKAYQHY